MPDIALVCELESLQDLAQEIRHQWTFGSDVSDGDMFALSLDEAGLGLMKLDEPKLGQIKVDFLEGKSRYRRQHSGARSEAIAKAVGAKPHYRPTVLDATAGLGRDSFVLASIGCQVTMMERHPVVAALLEDGLRRATRDPDVGQWIEERLFLSNDRGLLAPESTGGIYDVVYLDPMFPHKKKSALVKKEMRVFQELVGDDPDADALLAPALSLAQKRVVVKRPDYAAPLEEQKPSNCITMKKHRFDVYMINKDLKHT